jgi:hypothetical protein
MKKETVEWLYNWTKDKELVTVEELLTAFEKFKEPSNPTKQTAVEWLLENLNSEPYSEEDFKYNRDCWDKALEMEREQIIDAYETANGYSTGKNGEE